MLVVGIALVPCFFLTGLMIFGTPLSCKDCPAGFGYHYEVHRCIRVAKPDVVYKSMNLNGDKRLDFVKCPCDFAYVGGRYELCMNFEDMTDSLGDVVCDSTIKLVDQAWIAATVLALLGLLIVGLVKAYDWSQQRVVPVEEVKLTATQRRTHCEVAS